MGVISSSFLIWFTEKEWADIKAPEPPPGLPSYRDPRSSVCLELFAPGWASHGKEVFGEGLDKV